ncbi:hypothetical protein [Mucilaginibacter dorajii]|uniref:Macroglobulin domain-containing protein n=1 Tax=Mucilaginibacter dorajii TaxID=692994 RepID=A0ABP7Q2U7_9SPHI|nr:hypothetical protein [Mucilaginibacter dorajii]MCS3732826.1 hypothetical protein [Mucilaginibacter dorajii]
MKKLLLQCIPLFLLLTTALEVFPQQNKVIINQLAGRLNTYTDSLALASVYLKTSKDVYESQEDLWFKAYVLDSQYHNLFSIDKTLYVRLVKAGKDSVVWEEKYPITQGVVSGHIYLGQSLPEGDYYLSAYSAHSFYQNQSYFHALKMIKFIKETRSLLKEKPARIPGDANLPQDIQFSILPEGGQLVSGITNTVAFKAVDKNGKPVVVSGELLQENLPVTTFKSIHAGMGSFYFKPVPGANYQVRLIRPKSDRLYPLAAIHDKGVILHLAKNKKDSLIFNIVQSAGSAKRPVYLRVQVRGRIQAVAAAMLGDSLKITIPTADAPQGIAEVTLFDQEMRPLAERLVYLNPDNALNITASLSREVYKTREKISLKIRTSDKNGKPVQASIGVNVYDKLYHNPEDAKDILTHYYLSTQLKGRIYDPAYYFDAGNKDRNEALDLLLLTQGWRCYLWNEDELKEFKNRKQVLTDSTKGRLIAVDVKKNKPKIQMLMVFSTDEREKRSLFTDSIGRFALAPGDFVKGRWSYLKHFDVGKAEYMVAVEDQFKEIGNVSKNILFEYPVGEKATAEKENDIPPGRISMGAINLNEVKVVAKKQNVFRDKYMGHLDSLAKLEGNTDFVYPNSNWLNVPSGANGTKPIEGQKYTIWVGATPPTKAPFSFGTGDFKEIIYHYPKFTEEELLKKFNLTRIKGYYEKREFYQPNYDKESDPLPDYRNTLLWAPVMITDKNGEATLNFFCSDINSNFIGTVEGVGSNGLLGKKEFYFNVIK